MQGAVKVLNGSGHTTVEFDTDSPTGTVDADEVLAKASRTNSAVFDAKTKERVSGKPDLKEHEEILIVPPMAGG